MRSNTRETNTASTKLYKYKWELKKHVVYQKYQREETTLPRMGEAAWGNLPDGTRSSVDSSFARRTEKLIRFELGMYDMHRRHDRSRTAEFSIDGCPASSAM